MEGGAIVGGQSSPQYKEMSIRGTIRGNGKFKNPAKNAIIECGHKSEPPKAHSSVSVGPISPWKGSSGIGGKADRSAGVAGDVEGTVLVNASTYIELIRDRKVTFFSLGNKNVARCITALATRWRKTSYIHTTHTTYNLTMF